MTSTQAQTEAAHQIRVWLGRNATAETNPEKKAAFIEAHNVALKIEEAALTAAAEAGPKYKTWQDADREDRNVTIERCAQVADHHAKTSDWEGAETAKAIAADIRAMKEKP